MTHVGIPKAERDKLGITENMIRLSVGIENSEDLIADLQQALAAAVSTVLIARWRRGNTQLAGGVSHNCRFVLNLSLRPL